MPLSQSPDLSDKEIWQDKMTHMKELEDELYTVAENLIEKWRIRYWESWEDPDMLIWMFNILPEIFEKRLNTTREVLLWKYAAFHPLIWSTTYYNSSKPFDLPGDAIQKCAEQLLAELRAANLSWDTSILKL